MSTLRTDLLAETARLVDVASVSRSETALADLVEAELVSRPWLEVVRVGDNLVARTLLDRPGRLVLAGHLDTVPASGNDRARVEGDVLYGVGSADMKGGLAVMLALSSVARPVHDLSFVFYSCEEVARAESGLLCLAAARPELLEADAAILLEPTAAAVEAGCQGVVRAVVTMKGVRAHVARAWTGSNAIHRLGPVLERVAAFEERRPVLDGCAFRESLQGVKVGGGHAANVLPDEASLDLSYRFAPDRDVTTAFAALEEHLRPALDLASGDHVELVDSAPAAPPSLDHPLLRALVDRSGQVPRGKLGWTDVAFFAERGVPAANYGPGDPLVAHSPAEHVLRRDLETVFATLASLVSAA